MINRTDPKYLEARWRVKIGHAFLEKGHDIRGVVHIGANDGYEVPFYLELGIEKVLCFEPYPHAVELFKVKNKEGLESGRVKLYEIGLCDGFGPKKLKLNIAPGEGQSSSFLDPQEKYEKMSPFCDIKNCGLGTVECEVWPYWRFMTEHQEINQNDYDCLVIDVQGMELEALKGMKDELRHFNFINVECSADPVYRGEAPAEQIIEYLENAGFNQDTPIEPHNDIMFTRRGL